MANPATANDFKIAAYASGVGALVTLASLGIPNPHSIFLSGSSKAKLGDNSARVLGAPRVEWHFGFIQQSVRDTLRTYCTGASAHVYIVTPTIENVSSVPNAAQRYEAQMIWPDPDKPEDPNTGRRLEFVLLFRQLVSA